MNKDTKRKRKNNKAEASKMEAEIAQILGEAPREFATSRLKRNNHGPTFIEEEYPPEFVQLDTSINLESGTCGDLPPQHIVYNATLSVHNPVEPDECHYFLNYQHVYSVRYDKRKRAKFSEVPRQEPTQEPSRKLPGAETMRRVYKKFIEGHTKLRRIDIPLKPQEKHYGGLQNKYMCEIMQEPYFTFKNIDDVNLFPHFSAEQLREIVGFSTVTRKYLITHINQ